MDRKRSDDAGVRPRARLDVDIPPAPGQQGRGALRPLDEHDLVAFAELAPTELPYLLRIFEPVQVEMRNRRAARRLVAKQKIEGWRGHAGPDAGAAGNGTGQHGLARTQLAVQRDYDRPARVLADLFTPGLQAAFVQLDRPDPGVLEGRWRWRGRGTSTAAVGT